MGNIHAVEYGFVNRSDMAGCQNGHQRRPLRNADHSIQSPVIILNNVLFDFGTLIRKAYVLGRKP